MGATHTTLASSTEDATRAWLETLDYAIDERLYPGSGRMMRTFRLSHKNTGSLVVAKSMWSTQEDVDTIKAQQAELERIKEALKGQPHVAPFFFWNLGSIIQQQQLQVRPIALVRNHVYTTLSDRLESRPFLMSVEKLYIIHQLLSALQAMHDAKVLHGYLTTENVCLTSWNYVVIVDIASYKSRTALPDDDPSEYLYYFQEFHKQQDTNTQREKRCYLAPERFYSPKSSTKPEEDTKLTPSMDVFSAGCIVLETWLNGERALDLGDLMDYRNQQSFPPSLQQKFQKIESSSLRAACRHMLHLDPLQRLSPAEYLERLQDIIPSTFSESLEPLMERFTNDVFTPDARMALAAAHYHKILEATAGVEDDSGKKYFCKILGPTLCQLEQLFDVEEKEDAISEDDFAADNLLQETEALLKRLETLDFEDRVDAISATKDDPSGAPDDKKKAKKSITSPDSLLIFVQLILANLRHVTRPSSKLVALQLLVRLGKYSSDETRLQRIVPSTIFLLQDQDPLVRALALKVMTTALSQIQSFPPSDSKIFPQYVFKRVVHLLTDPAVVVRIAFSECISVLAETSRRFLDISHAVRLYEAVGGGGSGNITDKIKVSASSGELAVFDDDIVKLLDGPSKEGEEGKDSGPNQSSTTKGTGALHTLIANTYDAEVSALHEVVSRWVVHITTSEQSSSPKEALLSDLARLCNFFGRDGVMAFVLPQILAFLNDRRDWQLRAALFDDLPSACFIIGRAATEHFVLPCLETALVDSEDQVLRSALMCLTALVDLGLLSRSVLVDTRSIGLKERNKRGALFDRYCPLLLFPAKEVRHGAIVFVNACCKAFGSPDAEVFLLPILRPYLRFEPADRHLRTPEGLKKCLITSWTQARLTGGILRAAKGNEANDAQESEADSLMRDYLKMIYRSRMSKAESSDVSAKLAAAIEGSLKLSQSVKFPAQAAASAIDKPIPLWFGNARSIAKDSSESASEFSSLQSVAALNQVYGLSIMEGNEKAPDVPEDTIISGEVNHSNEQLVSCMNTGKAKQIDASVNGEWGAECTLDPSLDTTTNLVGKLKGLGVPTLSPRLGVTLDNGPSKEALSNGMGDWRPKIETLIASSSPIGGHSGPVSRLAVSQDQRFFVSGSFDSTCKVWELGKIDSSSGIMDSSTTYSGHNEIDSTKHARVNDIALLEKSHSVASASSNGQVHVWRVDLVSSRLSSQTTSPTTGASSESARVSGSSVVRTVDSAKEGEVLAVSHFNTLSESVLTFATQRGAVHSWDLRSEKEPFQLKHPAELGYLTSMALGTDRNWMITGTSKGFIALWDVRWKSMVKLWHHPGSEAVTRLATSYAPVPSARTNSGPKPLMFVSAGNECGMFDILDGTCRQGFRVLGSKGATGVSPSRADLTSLQEIDVSTRNLSSRLRSQGLLQRRENQSMVSRGPQMNAMVGSMGGYDQNYLITGGGDAHIRYWDFSTPTKCYTVSGQVGFQQRPNYERLDFAGSNRLMVCRQTTGLRLQDLESSRVPRRLQRGLIRAESRHQDAILDLKLIQSPIKAIVSCSRDGSIKLFK